MFLITVIITLVVGVYSLRYYIRKSWIQFNEVHDLTGKTVIITGANSGLGEAAALRFAQQKARVILACRSHERGEASQKRIVESCGGDCDVTLELIDTSKLDSVRRFCEKMKENNERIDVLVNNAGVSRIPFGRTSDNLEVSYATNYFGHFLLTNLLLDQINHSEGRIVNLSSFVHARSDLQLDVITPDEILFFKRSHNFTTEQMLGKIYANSKLMINMFTNELARRTKDTGLRVNCLCPGVVKTNIIKNPNFAVGILMKILYFFGKTPEQGAHTILHCALSIDVTTGGYYRNCDDVTKTDSHPMALDEEKCAALWEITEKMVGLVDH